VEQRTDLNSQGYGVRASKLPGTAEKTHLIGGSKLEKNVGDLDAFLRILLGIFLIYLGLHVLQGIDGKPLGIIVALISLMPFYMAITRKCFVFRFLHISSIPRKKS